MSTLTTSSPSDQDAYFAVLNGWAGPPPLTTTVFIPPLGPEAIVAQYTIMDDGSGTWTLTVPDGTDTDALGAALAASQTTPSSSRSSKSSSSSSA
jgi:hypothetical protein